MEEKNNLQGEYGPNRRNGLSQRTVRRLAWGRVKGRLREKEQKMEDYNETDSTVENWSDSTIKSVEEIQGASALKENIFNIFTMNDDEGESSLHDTQSESDESIKRGDSDKGDDDRLTPTFMDQRRKARRKRTRRGSKCMSCGIDCNMNIPDEEENLPNRGRHAKNEEGLKQMAEEEKEERDEKRKMEMKKGEINVLSDMKNWHVGGSVENLRQENEINWFSYAEPEAIDEWLIEGDQETQSLIRRQPLMPQREATGPKYRIILVLTAGEKAMICHATFDTGAFTSTISKKYCDKLGARCFRVEATQAKGCTSTITIKENCVLNVNLGSVSCEMTFSVIDDNDYNTSLILLGSNFFDGLGVTADFDKRRVYIKRKYPVKLFDSDEAALAQIRKINSDYTTREIVKIILDKRVTIEPWERKQLEVFLKEEQAEILENYAAYGRAYKLPSGLRSADILIHRNFDYKRQPVLIGIVNSTSRTITIRSRTPIFCIKPVFESISPAESETESNLISNLLGSKKKRKDQRTEVEKLREKQKAARNSMGSIFMLQPEDEKQESDGEFDMSNFSEMESRDIFSIDEAASKKRKIGETSEETKDDKWELKKGNLKFRPYAEDEVILKDWRKEDVSPLSMEEIERRLLQQTPKDGEYEMKKLPEEWGRKMTLETFRTN